MNKDVKFDEFFGPASLFGVVAGTAYLILIVFRVFEISIGFAAVVVIGFPLMLASGALRRFGTGLMASLAVIPLALVTFLLAASVGASFGG